MNQYRPSVVTTSLTWAGLALVGLLVVLAEAGLPVTADSMAREYPEFAHLEVPFLIAAIGFGVCIEALLVVTAILVGLIRADRILRPSALRLVDALIAIVVVAVIPVALVLPNIPGPPALAIAMEAGILIDATAALVLLALRSLLRRAISMRSELDEVV
jgi:hypothetical protein